MKASEPPATAFDTQLDELQPVAPGAPVDPLRRHRRMLSRNFFGAGLAISVLCAMVLAVFPQDIEAGLRMRMVGAVLAVASVCLLASFSPLRWLEAAMAAVLGVATLSVVAVAVWLDWGITTPGVGFLGLFICLVAAAISVRLAVAVAVACMAALLGLAWGQHQGWFGPSMSPGVLAARTGLSVLLLLASGVGGWIISRMVHTHARRAAERENRFRSLLAIAADAYWEIDRDNKLVELRVQREGGTTLSARRALGTVPWEDAALSLEPAAHDQLLADLQARVPFHNVAAQWKTAHNQVLNFAVSGEPRFDRTGKFAGYWGVARDVTADVQAQVRLQATEGRFDELFTRIPNPLVLHRRGLIVDANPAALRLLGEGRSETVLGRKLLDFVASGDSRETARRRLERLEELPVGEALPVADFQLVGAAARRVVVRSTGVRVMMADSPATLSIWVDDTERRAAEDVVRRSETMLQYLVATSPDVITLTDMATGRYVMANHTFEQLTGWSASEVVGRTSGEIGIWEQPEERDRLIGSVKQHGSVKDMPVTFRTRAGLAAPMLVSAAPFKLDERDYLVINARDISAAERERLEREAILETASVGIAVTRNERFVHVNPKFEQLYGWVPGTMAGQPGRVAWASDEEYARASAEIGPRLARGEVVDLAYDAPRRDGSTFSAHLVANPIDPSRPRDGGTVWIVEDVTQARRDGAALAKARDEAEAANRAKSAFLANTSHELRTPLNGMIGLARMAREPGLAEDKRTLYLDQLAESAQSLAAIITDVLDLSKIEAGRLDLEDTVFSLPQLLRSMHLGYTMLANARGLTLSLDLATDLQGDVRGDPTRLRQILSNYLSNALKFTTQGGVQLRATRLAGSDRVRFEVIDTGPGIDSAVQGRLFRAFTQADESITRRFGGTGLGLAICHELASLMHGEVGVQSATGQGACFWAEIPLPPQVALAGGTAPGDAAAAVDEGQTLQGRRVLLAEDNAVNMLIASSLLERWGVQVTQAVDGKEAVAAVAQAEAQGEGFDAVLMDVQMPELSGYDATRELRRQHSGLALPVIALTAAALVSEREEALAAGMNDFLTKPIDADRLRATLSRWITQRQPAAAASAADAGP